MGIIVLTPPSRQLLLRCSTFRHPSPCRHSRDTGISREGLYKALSAEGNPEFATVMKVVKAQSDAHGRAHATARHEETPRTKGGVASIEAWLALTRCQVTHRCRKPTATASLNQSVEGYI